MRLLVVQFIRWISLKVIKFHHGKIFNWIFHEHLIEFQIDSGFIENQYFLS